MTMRPSSVSSSPPNFDDGHRVSAIDRVVNVVIDPAAAFHGLEARPVWLVAFVALVALRIGSLFAFYQPETSAAKLIAGMLFQVVTLMPLLAILTTLLWIAAAAWRSELP